MVDCYEAASNNVSIDGLRVHYQVLGQDTGLLPVVFLHGGGPGSTSWSNFRLNCQPFIGNRLCYFIDLPQFGKSDVVPVQGPVFSWHANILQRVLQALGIQRAHLINQSFGSGVALKFAAQYSGMAGRIVTIGAQPVSAGVMAPLPLFSKHGADIMTAYYLENGGPSREKMAGLIRKYELYQDEKLDEVSLELRFQASNNPEFIKLLEAAGSFGEPEDLVLELSRVQSPVLMCWGLHDWFGSVDVPMLLLNRLQDARLYVFGNAAHHLQTECPHEFNRVASSFIGDE